MNNGIKLSVIVPVYNEETRIKNIHKISSYFKKNFPDFELIVVNDGSFDQTLNFLNQYVQHPIRIISYNRNKGKGYAIRRGMKIAKGEYRIFMDIDLATPLEEFKKFKEHIENGKASVLIGSRKKRGAKILRSQSRIRKNMGQIFTSLSQIVTRVPVTDFTCGFKCFSAKAAEKIFKNAKINKWGFDSEILFLSKKYNFEIYEIPVSWRNDSQTRVKFPQDIIYSLMELFAIILNDLRRKY